MTEAGIPELVEAIDGVKAGLGWFALVVSLIGLAIVVAISNIDRK